MRRAGHGPLVPRSGATLRRMAAPPLVYHLELRAFPNVARAFNLARAELDARFLRPWAAGELVEFDDRRWAPDRTRLTVYAGPPVERSGRGLGRGWGEVTRRAREVTDDVLAESRRGAAARPEVEALTAALAEVAARPDGIGFPDAIALAATGHPGWRASEQLSLAEQAVWEMLHRRQLTLQDADGRSLPPERWEEIVLSWAVWAGDAAAEPVRLRITPAP
jgi:hypothetical protein